VAGQAAPQPLRTAGGTKDSRTLTPFPHGPAHTPRLTPLSAGPPDRLPGRFSRDRLDNDRGVRTSEGRRAGVWSRGGHETKAATENLRLVFLLRLGRPLGAVVRRAGSRHRQYGTNAEDTLRVAYVDESGNAGWNGSPYYSLGCVMLEADSWPHTFEQVLGHRRWLRDSFGVLLRDEVKANFLTKNKGPFKALGLGEPARRRIYRSHLRLLDKVGMQAFSVMIHKHKIIKRTRDPRDLAWQFLLQRFERMTTKAGADLPVMLFHDEGDDKLVRQFARKARRAGRAGSAYGAGGWTPRPLRWLIEDPVPKRSDHSFFIQLADLTAYAAYRRLYPYNGAGSVGLVCPQSTWDELGGAIFAPANALAAGGHQLGAVPGIVEWPK
jgi:hypothetical protein